MIDHPAYACEPWCLRETALHLDVLAQSESVFALSNGHIGIRGNLDEGEPNGVPGTYLNSVYELRPLPYAEAGYGYPESGQTVLNVTNGKLIRLLVDDTPFDVRYGDVESHERSLDLRTGILERHVRWSSAAHRTVLISSQRLVSLTQRAIMAIRYEVEAVDQPVRIVVQSELVANEPMPDLGHDPRVAAVLESALQNEEHVAHGDTALLLHRTVRSGLRLGAAMHHTVKGPRGVHESAEAIADVARCTYTARLEPGQRLTLVKLVAYGWSAQRSRSAIHDQVRGALAAAQATGWEGLVAEQRAYLDDFWTRAAIDVEGDDEVQQAVRFALFHVLQAGARAERRPIPAKGLTGPGYDGHAFWDTEAYVLPVLNLTLPSATPDALRWRHRTLPAARERARQLGFRGAAFPWRTIDGQECSGYWPAGTAAFHVNADIADAVLQYVNCTGDLDFERDIGLELLVETARLWLSISHVDALGYTRIDGVTGPDEYSAIADNNIYTNLMAQRNLFAAADAAERHEDQSRAMGVDDAEIGAWRSRAARMRIPYDERLQVHPQADGFTDHAEWDFANTSPDQYPLLLHFSYFDLYRKQVVKQADLVLAMLHRPDAFTPEQKARNFAYYERLTVRDSSLSASIQSVIAAEVGHLDLAYDYLCEAALMDLADIEHNTRDGVHIASLAGAWIAVVGGLGGLRVDGTLARFAPRLPDGLRRVRFHIVFRDRRLRVSFTPTEATYELLDGAELDVTHHGETLTLGAGTEVTRPIPPAPTLPRPTQPPGREPLSWRSRRPPTAAS